MKHITVVAAAIIRDELCLVAQRGPSMSLAGKWEFPGGKIEPGESPVQALKRELYEELSIHVTVGSLISNETHTYGFGVVELAVFTASLLGPEPRAEEHAQLRWCDSRQLGNLDWAPADVPAAGTVATLLTGASSGPKPDRIGTRRRL